MAMLPLPKDKKKLSTICRMIVRQGLNLRNIERIEWLLNYYYLRGVRKFDMLDFRSGRVVAQFRNEYGKLTYRYEQCTRRYQDEVGRRLQVDVRPTVSREGLSTLDGLRKASMAQITLNTQVKDIDLEQVKRELVHHQVLYGTTGLACWGQESARFDRTQALLEVVPPWQLIPIPADPASESDLVGMCRHRVVSYDWIKEKQGLSFPKDKKYMETRKEVLGKNPSDSDMSDEVAGGGPLQASPNDFKRSDDVQETDLEYEVGDLDEIWLWAEDRQTLSRYIVMFGGWVVKDVDYTAEGFEQEPPVMPIHRIVDIDTGRFYGKSTFSLMRPTNMEVEYLMRNLYENAQDLDLFGFTMVPSTQGINVRQFKASGKPRVIAFDPDLAVPNVKAYNIAPANPGDWPGQVAGLGMQVINDMAGQSEVMRGEAPGRVDSAVGLAQLQEAASMPLSAPMGSLAAAFTGCYKAMLGMARSTWPKRSLARLTLMDDNIAGIVVNPQTGEIDLDNNDIPLPWEVEISIRSQKPISKAERQMQITQLLQLGVIDPRTFRRVVRVEGLDLPVGNEAEWQNWRKAILYNVILFGDGEKPGQITVSSEMDLPEVQLDAIQAFMARPEFALASKEVKDAFEERKSMILNMAGQYPQQMPYPEDAALEQQQMMQGGGGMAGLPGM
jgi:hypothetical protein